MSDRERAERAAQRAARMTARVERAGCVAPPVVEVVLEGTAAVELACELTRGTYALLGHPVRTIPRADWPGEVRRAPAS